MRNAVHREEAAAIPDAGPRRRTTRRPLHAVEDWEQPSSSSGKSYFEGLSRYPLLSREEEHRLATEFVRTRDARLADRLVTANLRLVVKIAREYRASRTHLQDLVQEGNVGLVYAVGKFDPTRGVKLVTYAAWWIRAHMLKFILTNARIVKLGTTQAQRRLFFGLGRESARLAKGNDGPVDPSALAKVFDVSVKEVVDMGQRLTGADASLDAPARSTSRDSRSLGEVLGADESDRPDALVETQEFESSFGREVQRFTTTLSGRDADIFRRRLLGDGAITLSKIAAEHGVSRERIRQLETRVKARLRAHLRETLGDAVPAAS
jgi:RNA polymerase sigma-32 factor